MTCEACRAACVHPVHNEIAQKFHAASEVVCGCEAFVVSDYSPGVVADSEVLNLIISYPKSVVDGKLNPSALIQMDRGGLSVLRHQATDEEFVLTCEQLRERANSSNSEWNLHAVCTFSTEVVRYDGDSRFLCVYDTAEEDKIHHADVVGPDYRSIIKPAPSTTAVERMWRKRYKAMIDKIGPVFISPNEFRKGCLLQFAAVGNSIS